MLPSALFLSRPWTGLRSLFPSKTSRETRSEPDCTKRQSRRLRNHRRSVLEMVHLPIRAFCHPQFNCGNPAGVGKSEEAIFRRSAVGRTVTKEAGSDHAQ